MSEYSDFIKDELGFSQETVEELKKYSELDLQMCKFLHECARDFSPELVFRVLKDWVERLEESYQRSLVNSIQKPPKPPKIFPNCANCADYMDCDNE